MAVDDQGEAAGQSPLDAQRRAEQAHDAYSERPHVFVAAALAGGFLAAQLLKHLGGGDDD
jgi:muramoyltetrapeptide carboxypeptidase LdcA involved in peptidoglycan recycling